MRRALLFCGIFIVVTAASCKKENEQSATCRVSRVDELFGSSSNIIEATYDALGRPATVTTNGVVRTFSYSGRSVVITTSYSKDSSVLNEAGYVLAHYQLGNGASPGFVQEHFYRGTEVQYTLYRTVGDPVSDTIFYEWRDGNMVARRFSSGGVEQFEYYTDKPVVDNSDRERISSLFFRGGYLIASRNLRKTAGSGALARTFFYDLDPNGRVLVERNDKGVFSGEYRYTYVCQ